MRGALRRSAIGAATIAAALFAGHAGASSMMPAGDAPEAGLKGLWRVVQAQPAPWSQIRLHTAHDAPVLEYAVEFTDGEVKGPSPLACKTAHYSSGVSEFAEAFSGHLAKDASGAIAAKLELSDPRLSTFRVICGKTVRDFYVDDESRLLWAEGQILYALERPEGNPDQYPVGYSGPSFDCVQAKSTLEHLVCRDAALSKSDSAMSKAYRALENSETRESFATVRAAQKAWIAYVAKHCNAGGAMPGTYGDRKTVVDCLADLYDERSELISGLKTANAGPLKLEPRMRFRARPQPAAAESDVYPWMSGGKPAEAFNAFIASQLHPDKWRIDDRNIFPNDADLDDLTLMARRSYSLAGFDSRIVSVQIATLDFTGANRDVAGQTSLTWDMKTGRRVLLQDIFVPGSKWKAAVANYCWRDLKRQFAERGATDEPDAAEIDSTLSADTNWLWSRDNASVVFAEVTIGGLAAGELDVDIPLKDLAPYMKPDAAVR